MANIIRWDPFREMTTLRDSMDRFFEDPFSQAPRLWERAAESRDMSLALDITEDEKEFVVKASLPGVPAEDVDVTLSDNILTIRGEIKDENDVEEKNYHLRERRWGGFVRSVSLPAGVDVDHVEAINENGVLTLHLPKVESAKPKRISVKKMVESK